MALRTRLSLSLPQSKKDIPIFEEHAFTLIEILLALAITAVVITIVNMTFFSSHRVTKAVRVRSEAYQMVRIVIDRMVKDISSAYVPEKVKKDTIDMYRFIGMNNDEEEGVDKDSIYLTTTSNIGFGKIKSGVCEVDYYLRPMEEAKNLYYLIRRDDCTPHLGITDSGNAFEMAEDIVGMNIVYVDKDLNEMDHWDLEEMGCLPKEVKVTLTLRIGDANLAFTGCAFLSLSAIKPDIG